MKERIRRIVAPRSKDLSRKQRYLYFIIYMLICLSQAYMISYLGRRLTYFPIFLVVYFSALIGFIYWLDLECMRGSSNKNRKGKVSD